MFRLYLLQASAFLATWLSTYYPGLDILFSLLYLVIIKVEAGRMKGYSSFRILLVALIWQGPAALLGWLVIGDFHIPALSGNAIFLLEFWVTPLLPLLTLFSNYNYFARPMYYYGILAAPWLLGSAFFILGLLQNRSTNKTSAGGFKNRKSVYRQRL